MYMYLLYVFWKVEYQTLQGEKVVKRFEGRPAIIFQHEYDHLDKVRTLIIVCMAVVFILSTIVSTRVI